MSPYDIFIIHMSWGTSGKARPVLAFMVNNKTVNIYRITSQYENKSAAIKSQYFAINDWALAGLKKASYIDTGILIELPATAFKGKPPIGRLSDSDKRRLFKFLS
ncbi:MAG: hypothetical protein FWC16_13270 [Defluviitaleaceae bacterium]|nr:hypothetical protein [Defluviitaleaceae bacterium]MCL2275891.1 hypothetical protein [Defluviitaleaceae bacterium]